MKRCAAIFLVLAGILAWTGCRQETGTQTPSGADSGAQTAGSPGLGQDENTGALRLRIVDGAQSGSLILAGEGSGDVYALELDGAEIPVLLDGEAADASVLEDGMTVEVAFDGLMLETFPAQLGEVRSVSAYSLGTGQNPGGTTYDLCGLYLQVLNDLWDRDEGLNGSAACVSVDLSQAPGGLTDGEREAVAWIFAGQHGVQPLTLTYDELAEQGYLSAPEGNGPEEYYVWEDGILFSITAREWEEGEAYSLPVVKFDAEKWRGPLGAYWLFDCFAVWPELGTWSGYQIGGDIIA